MKYRGRPMAEEKNTENNSGLGANGQFYPQLYPGGLKGRTE